MAALKMVASGLATPLPAMSGALPWLGSYKPWLLAFKEAEGNDQAWDKFQNAVQPKAKLRVTYSRTRILAYAAVIGLFVLSGIVLFKFNSNSKTLLLVANNTTIAGEMKELKLADGSIITMNGASNVSFELTADQRKIKLKDYTLLSVILFVSNNYLYALQSLDLWFAEAGQ